MRSLKGCLECGQYDDRLTALYGREQLECARARCSRVVDLFADSFGGEAEQLFSAPGRTELGGNHTDHQRGCVLAAAVDLDILAAVRPNGGNLFRLCSEGYPRVEVDLSDLMPREKEVNTTAALIRGMAAGMKELGCPVGGVDAAVISSVPGGSGLSSSAAFEVLVGTLFNELFGQGACTPLQIARVGQYAEQVFFGKPCGLMDQTACAVGGVVAIDFADPTDPVVEELRFDLAGAGYALCIIDSGADHADLTDEYAAITRELKSVCEVFGKECLREVEEDAFWAQLPRVREVAGDRAVLRAIHVFHENRRAVAEASALRRGEFEEFLALVKESGRSSALYLQNVVPLGRTVRQELLLTMAVCEEILAGKGAVRVHGGGFGGTAQAFVPLEELERFHKQVDAVLGSGRCRVVTVRPVGGVRLV